VIELQEKAHNAANAGRILRQDAEDFMRARRSPVRPALTDVQQRLVGDLKRDGFAVLPGYWERDRALAMRDRLEAFLEPAGDRDFDSGAYLRFWDENSYDQGVRRLYQVDREVPELREFRNDNFPLDVVAAASKIPFYSVMLMFQHNLQTNENTRYYHVDAFEREFKSFLYLDDVDDGNGPFAYLPGTHRKHLLRLKKQVVGNRDDNDTSFYPEEIGMGLESETRITGPAGTLIIANVRGLHRGTPQQDRSRSVLVNYFLRRPGEVDLNR
jgi:hypothetical protein